MLSQDTWYLPGDHQEKSTLNQFHCEVFSKQESIGEEEKSLNSRQS